MAVERLIGVDFGTSTSVIRVKRYENGKPIGEKLETKEVVFGGSGAMVPTLIMKKNDDASVCYFGDEAKNAGKKYTQFHGFKMDLESSDPVKRNQARLLTEEFYAYLAKQYKSQSEGGHLGNPDDKERTIISYPVKWSEETKNFMLETAKKAGFPNVTGMDEAQAAIQAVVVMSTDHLQRHGLLKNGEGANILLIDMGAGTTDLVLSRYTPGEKSKTEVLSTWPKSGDVQFGGREIDGLLQNFFRDLLDEDDAAMVFRRIGADKFKSWKEWTVSPKLLKNDSVGEFEALDSCVEIMDIDLADYCLDRAAFENCLADYLKQFPELIDGCLTDAGMSGSDVDLVIVTGGHSQWYFVNDMLAGKMPQFGVLDLPKIRENPARIIPISRPQETVALGLAYSEAFVDKQPTTHKTELAFALEIEQVFPASNLVAVGGNVALGSIKVGDKVFVRSQGELLQGYVKKIANPKKNTSFQNGSCAQEGEFAVLGLEGIGIDMLLPGMILFTGTNDGKDVSSEALVKVVKNRKTQIGNEPEKADEEKRSGDILEQKRREQERRDRENWERERLEQERRDREHWERERREQERRDRERREQERREQERLAQERRARELEEARRRAESLRVNPKDLPDTPDSEFEIYSVGGTDCGIKRYLGNSSVVKIPSSIRGRKVVAIGPMVFGGLTLLDANRTLETVVIPETVRKLEMRAFSACPNLRVVIAHKNIESIGMGAFFACHSLRKIDFGMGECAEGHLILPPNLKSIGAQAFLKNDLFSSCIFKEVMMSRRTKVMDLPGFKNFPSKSCALFYYD